MARSASPKVQFTGPFFEPKGQETLRRNIRGMLQGMADEGEGAVQGILAPHNKSGALSSSIHGRTRSLSGKQWALTAVISSNLNEQIARDRGQTSGNWRGSYAGFIETGLRQNGRVRTGSTVKMTKSGTLKVVGVYERRRITTSFHGYRMFRATAAGLNRSRAAAVADLTRGLT